MWSFQDNENRRSPYDFTIYLDASIDKKESAMPRKPLIQGLDDYRQLWAAVMYQALLDLHQDRPGERWNLIRNKALAWFMSDREWIGSFNYICRVLDLDPRKTLEHALLCGENIYGNEMPVRRGMI